MLLQVLRIRTTRPMHKVQINVIQPQVLQRRVNGLGHALVPGVVELGGDPDVGAGHAGVADGGADLGLVAVGEGGVDVAVAVGEGGEDGVVDLVGGRLPGAEADGGDFGTGVELEGASGEFMSVLVVEGEEWRWVRRGEET